MAVTIVLSSSNIEISMCGLVVMIAAFHLQISGRAEFDSPYMHQFFAFWQPHHFSKCDTRM